MATDILVHPDPKRDAKAAQLAKTAHTWHVVTLRKPWGAFKVGDAFLQTPNGYRVNAVWCSCPDYLQWGHICKHVRAVRLMDAAKVTPVSEPAVAPTPVLKRYEKIFPQDCMALGCLKPAGTDDPDYCSDHELCSAF